MTHFLVLQRVWKGIFHNLEVHLKIDSRMQSLSYLINVCHDNVFDRLHHVSNH